MMSLWALRFSGQSILGRPPGQRGARRGSRDCHIWTTTGVHTGGREPAGSTSPNSLLSDAGSWDSVGITPTPGHVETEPESPQHVCGMQGRGGPSPSSGAQPLKRHDMWPVRGDGTAKRSDRAVRGGRTDPAVSLPPRPVPVHRSPSPGFVSSPERKGCPLPETPGLVVVCVLSLRAAVRWTGRLGHASLGRPSWTRSVSPERRTSTPELRRCFAYATGAPG